MKKPPEHFVLDPQGSRAYLEAILLDAGFSSLAASSIATDAHDCGGGDGDPRWQKAQLERARREFVEQADDLRGKASALDRVIEQFYADIISVDETLDDEPMPLPMPVDAS